MAQPNFALASARSPSGRPGLDMSQLHLKSESQHTSSSHAAQDSLADSALPTFLPQQADLQQHEHHQTDLARQRGLHQFDAQGHHILGSEQQDAGFHEHGVSGAGGGGLRAVHKQSDERPERSGAGWGLPQPMGVASWGDEPCDQGRLVASIVWRDAGQPPLAANPEASGNGWW